MGMLIPAEGARELVSGATPNFWPLCGDRVAVRATLAGSLMRRESGGHARQ